jgi:hypothetical protein
MRGLPPALGAFLLALAACGGPPALVPPSLELDVTAPAMYQGLPLIATGSTVPKLIPPNTYRFTFPLSQLDTFELQLLKYNMAADTGQVEITFEPATIVPKKPEPAPNVTEIDLQFSTTCGGAVSCPQQNAGGEVPPYLGAFTVRWSDGTSASGEP